MGDPAIPTPEERAARRRLAAAIVESVAADTEMPLPLDGCEICQPGGSHVGRYVDRDCVEQLAFELAQEVVMLSEQLAAVGREGA